jgi:hypothetical protein
MNTTNTDKKASAPAEVAQTLKVNDRIEVRHGPFRAKAKVIKITKVGAVLEYDPTAELIGWEHGIVHAPNGDALTDNPLHGFIGRAHWPSVVRQG